MTVEALTPGSAHVPAPDASDELRHLRRLTDDGGLHEHALLTEPRPEHGYCVDDVARGVVLLCRRIGDDGGEDLRQQYLSFVLASQTADGRIRNRRGPDRRWLGPGSVEDCWGRAVWALGEAAARGDGPAADAALEAFDRAARWRSGWPRATAYATLGAAAVLQADPGHRAARLLLSDAAGHLDRPHRGTQWLWPEPQLTYGNAVVAEVLIAAGGALGRDELVEDGLLLLRWLLAQETSGGHLSVTPVGGRGPGDVQPGYDQQPIEVAAIADACARAWSATGDRRWHDGLDLAAGWFRGDNDSGTALEDLASGGCCDGLEALGRNENQGAESTLAMLSTYQQLRSAGDS